MELKHTFPTYHKGQIPEVLHWWNPVHYWYLLVWIYFQPSKLRQYLWLADSDLYWATKWKGLQGMVRQPAYRNVLLMMPVLSLAVPTVVWAVFGGLGMEVGPWSAVASGVASIVAFSIISLIVGLGWGVGVASIVLIGRGVGVAFIVGGFVAETVAWGVDDEVATGVLSGMAIRMVFGVPGVVFGGFFGILFMASRGGMIDAGTDPSALTPLGLMLGSLRLPVSIGHWLLWGGGRKLTQHSVWRDEWMVLPAPRTRQRLAQALHTNWEAGLYQLAIIAANPFQRGYVQAALSTYLHQHPNPLAVFYMVSHDTRLDEYYREPIQPIDIDNFITKRKLLLGEVGQLFPNPDDYHKDSESFVRSLTRWQRVRKPSAISMFSVFVARLFVHHHNPEDSNTTQFLDKFLPPASYRAMAHYSHGAEIVATFDLIRAYLPLASMAEMANAPKLEAIEEPILRPAVVHALTALGDVSQHALAYGEATNTTVQATALNLAAGQLRELAHYTATQVLPPERALIQRIITIWEKLVAEAQGELGARAVQGMSQAELRAAEFAPRQSTIWERPLQPFDNPYVVGDPVYPPLFVGRKDIFNRITHVWGAKENPDSIILYGHRRMGKSSILRNLAEYAPPGHLLAYLDMGGETSFVESTADLLLALADKLYAVTRAAHPEAILPAPDAADYQQANRAQRAFNQLGAHIATAIAPHTLILALDEFEAIEQAVEAGKIGPEIFQFLRTKSQERWLTLVFGGLHTLDEMSRDYQQPFFGSYTNIPVSYLGQQEAERLITNPSPTFKLNYEREAVAEIIAQTGGQPYLVQLVCRDALDHLNRQMLDEGLDRLAKINTADVAWATSDELFQRGAIYFDGVWKQTTADDQQQLLRVMAQRPEPWTVGELLPLVGLAEEPLQQALRWGERHDVLRKTGDGDGTTWGFFVPLFRRWVATRKR
ncbi:MAG: ATP-binding protein [Chloroflexi bacterium]|nr:ATP-binding protein [Chloroflexota bacterium]